MTSPQDPILLIGKLLKSVLDLNASLDCPSLSRAGIELQKSLSAHPAQSHEGGLLQLSAAIHELEGLALSTVNPEITQTIKTCIVLLDSSIAALEKNEKAATKKFVTALISH